MAGHFPYFKDASILLSNRTFHLGLTTCREIDLLLWNQVDK